MKIFNVIFVALLLASCSKENDTKPSGTNNLTGTAKEVNDVVWGNAAPSGNHLVIDETSEFLNTSTGEIHSFKVETTKALASSSEENSGGVSYSDGVYEIKVYKSTLNAAQLRVYCYVSGVEVMGRWWNY